MMGRTVRGGALGDGQDGEGKGGTWDDRQGDKGAGPGVMGRAGRGGA